MTGMDGACMHQPTLRGSFSAVSKPIFVNKYFFRGDYTSAFFEIYRRPYRAKKKCEHFSSPPQKKFGGEGGRSNLSTEGALAKRGALACAYGALGAIYALRSVDLGSTLGLPAVISLAISGRCLIIFVEFLMKRDSRKVAFDEIVDFSKKKRHYGFLSLIHISEPTRH